MAVQKVAGASSLRASESDTHDSAQAATAPGFRHFLGTPRSIAAIPRVRHRPTEFACGLAATARTDASPVTANGCADKMAATHGVDRRKTGKIPSSPRATPICCSSWRMIWFIRRFRFRLREASAEGQPTPAARRFGWKPYSAAVLSDRRTSTRSTRRTTTGEPSCGSGECAGRRTSLRPDVRFETLRGPGPRT